MNFITLGFVSLLSIGGVLSTSDFLKAYDLKVCNNEPSCNLVNQPNLPRDRRTFDGRNCMCDFECVEYDDCCIDSEFYGAYTASGKKYSCSSTSQIYMLTTCPAGYTNQDTLSKCLASLEPLNGPDQSLVQPVTNLKKRITYGNQYCRLCNNDYDESNLFVWNLTAECGEVTRGFGQQAVDYFKYTRDVNKILQYARFDYNAGRYVSQYNGKNFVCQFSSKKPSDFELYERLCIPNVISSCPPSYPDQKTAENCLVSTAIVYEKASKQAYKNKDCAKCYGVSEISLTGCPIQERTGDSLFD